MTSPCMTVREAASFMSCTRSCIFQLIHSGKLPYQKLGRRFVVPRDAVETFLERNWKRNGNQ